MQTRIRIIGMRCRKCVAALQASLESVPGVTAVDVSFEHGDATIDHDAGVTRESLMDQVEAAGYDCA
jgi:copper chaperone CopZ